MPQPNNYQIQRPNLAGQNQAFGMGANLGQGFAESRQRQTKEAQALEIATAKKTEYDADILEVMNNPTSQSFLKLGLKHGKNLPFIQEQMSAMDSKSKDALVKRAAPAYYALENDKVDAAKGLLDTELEIAKAEGDEAKISQYQDFIGLLDTDPDQVKFALGAVLYEAMGAEDFEKIIGPSGQEKSAKALSQKASTKAGAESFAADLVEAQAVGLSQKNLLNKDQTKKLRADVLADRNVIIKGMKKPLADFARVQSLIDRIPTEQVGGVIKTNITKLVDLFTGGTEEGKAWKQELESYKLVDMLKNKPPGALSEGELKVLQAGVPSENAGAEVIENYLKASKKALQYSYAYDKLNIKFLEQNKDQGTASKDMKIYGETIKAGETYDDFVNRLGVKMLKYGPKKADGKKAVEDAKPKPMNRKDAANVLDFE